jgi:hypothetical protein
MTDGQHARPLAPQAHAARHCVVRAAAAAPAAPPPSRSPPESSLGAKRAGATGPLRTDATQHTNGSPLRRRPLEAAAVAQPSACKDAAAGGSSAAAAVRERPGCDSDYGRAAACAVVGGCAAAPGLLGYPDSSTPPGLRQLRSCDRSLACTVHPLLPTADGKGDSDSLAGPAYAQQTIACGCGAPDDRHPTSPREHSAGAGCINVYGATALEGPRQRRTEA